MAQQRQCRAKTCFEYKLVYSALRHNTSFEIFRDVVHRNTRTTSLTFAYQHFTIILKMGLGKIIVLIVLVLFCTYNMCTPVPNARKVILSSKQIRVVSLCMYVKQ